MNKQEHEEKRKFPRVKRNITIQFRIKQLPQPEEVQLSIQPYADITHTTNLSETGISFTVAHAIPIDTVLAIKLRLPSLPNGSFDLEARIVECKEGENKLVFGVRAEFVNLTEEHRQMLKEFVHSFLPENN